MSQAASIPYISPEDYLSAELRTDEKWEYRDGEVWCMGGASAEHVDINMNLIALLHAHLKGGPCKVRANDTRIKIETAHHLSYFYPDLIVTCAPQERGSAYTRSPRVIVEILSPSTEARDRSFKFSDYTSLESLQEYVLVDSRRRAAWVHRRGEGWKAHEVPAEGQLSLTSIDFACPLPLLYEDVELPA